MLQQADGDFGAFIMFPDGFGFGTSAVTLADIDRDGRLDIVSRSLYDGVVRLVVQLQQAGGALAPPQAYRSDGLGNSYSTLLALDTDGNGLIDLIDGNTWLMQLNQAPALSAQSARARPTMVANAAAQPPAAPVAALKSKLRTRWGR